MRVYGPSGTRSGWEDRAPAAVQLAGGSTAVGGANTQLFTYTVPANRRTRVIGQAISGLVTTAFAAGQTGLVRIGINAVGDHIVCGFQALAPIGTRDDRTFGEHWLLAGQTIVAFVTLGAGAGVLDAVAGLAGIEYDA